MYRLILRMDIAEIAAREQARQDAQTGMRGERNTPETRASRINGERQMALA